MRSRDIAAVRRECHVTEATVKRLSRYYDVVATSTVGPPTPPPSDGCNLLSQTLMLITDSITIIPYYTRLLSLLISRRFKGRIKGA